MSDTRWLDNLKARLAELPPPTPEQIARREEEHQRHEDMMRLVEQLSPEARQRIAQRLDGRFHGITSTEEPSDA